MKKIIFSLMVLAAGIVAIAQAQSQSPAPYKPLSEFNQDTIRYFLYNFEQNKSRYIGQKFETVIRDYGMEVKLIETESYNPGAALEQAIIDVYLHYWDDNGVYVNLIRKSDGRPYRSFCMLSVTFEPHCRLPYYLFQKEDGSPERNNIVKLNRLKDAIIGDMEVVVY